jgi:hypothetical protein
MLLEINCTEVKFLVYYIYIYIFLLTISPVLTSVSPHSGH